MFYRLPSNTVMPRESTPVVVVESQDWHGIAPFPLSLHEKNPDVTHCYVGVYKSGRPAMDIS